MLRIAPMFACALLILCNAGIGRAAEGETTQGAAQKKTEAPGARARSGCDQLPDAKQLTRLLREVPQQGEAGGFASGRFQWGAVVNRAGELCAVAVATEDGDATYLVWRDRVAEKTGQAVTTEV